MSGYQVRRVRADEWRQVREIRLEALRDTPIGFAEWYEDALAKPDAFWQERALRSAEAPDTALFAAFAGDGDDGRMVGTAGAFTKGEPGPAGGRELVIYGVFVTPEYRGPQRAVVSTLFDAVIRWARESAAADEITLSVHERNERAHSCYRRYGFVDTGETEPYNLDPAASLIVMRYPR